MIRLKVLKSPHRAGWMKLLTQHVIKSAFLEMAIHFVGGEASNLEFVFVLA